jgi:OmpA-OmpF porin, OOP family
MKLRIGILVVVVACVWCGSASGQFGGWKSLAKKAVKKAEEKKESPPTESQPAQPATSNTNNESTPSTNAPAASNSAGGNAAAAPSQAAGGEPNLVAAKMDFVPGEKTIFFDDFSDMPPGEPPPHWAVRDTSGPVELHMGGGVRELWIDNGANLISPKLAGPANFTAQLRFVCHSSDCYVTMDFPDYETNVGVNNSGGKLRLYSGSVHGTNLSSSLEVPSPQGQLAKVDFWMQNGRARVYLNGERVVDINQVSVPPFDHVKISAGGNGSGDVSDTGIRSFRLAESVPDLGAVLETTGKYVTHGIYFDTDSATLKPESAGVIQEISAALYKHQDMKLEIDGYTDSTGDAAHNLDLSKRRAEAVMKVLVSQFGIDASRLTSNGFGAQNPIASNDTPDGRAQNRRVEFIKQGANTGGSSGSGAGASAAPAPGGGTTASASAGHCAPPVVPTGTRLFPAYTSGSKDYVKLKSPEQVAYLMLLSIRSLEKRCNDELNRACTLPELVRGVQGSKTAFNGPTIGLTANPACDANYSYAVEKVTGGWGWRLTIEPRSAGLGGFLEDEGEPPGTGIYYNPSGAATKHSHKLNGNGWGVGAHAQGGDFERGRS